MYIKCFGSVCKTYWIFADNILFLELPEWIIFAFTSFPKGNALN